MAELHITHAHARHLIERLLPQVERESTFLTPDPAYFLSAPTVFDLIREFCDPVMTKDEFNAIADEVQEEIER